LILVAAGGFDGGHLSSVEVHCTVPTVSSTYTCSLTVCHTSGCGASNKFLKNEVPPPYVTSTFPLTLIKASPYIDSHACIFPFWLFSPSYLSPFSINLSFLLVLSPTSVPYFFKYEILIKNCLRKLVLLYFYCSTYMYIFWFCTYRLFLY
jgi:hypothetical protein